MLDKCPFMFKQSQPILIVFIPHQLFLAMRDQTNLLQNSSEASNDYGPANVKWKKIQE